MKISEVLSKIPPAVKLPLAIFLTIIVLLSLWLWGARATNWVSRKIFNGKNAIITRDMQKNLDDAEKSKAATARTMIELAAKKEELAKEKEAYETEKQKLAIAERILSDKSKNTDQKLRAYEEAVNRAPTVHVEPESNAEQCKRAAELGIDLPICH